MNKPILEPDLEMLFNDLDMLEVERHQIDIKAEQITKQIIEAHPWKPGDKIKVTFQNPRNGYQEEHYFLFVDEIKLRRKKDDTGFEYDVNYLKCKADGTVGKTPGYLSHKLVETRNITRPQK